MKYELIVLKVNKPVTKPFLRKIKSNIEALLPKIPTRISINDQKISISSQTIFFNSINELREFFNFSEKEWKALEKGILARISSGLSTIYLVISKEKVKV